MSTHQAGGQAGGFAEERFNRRRRSWRRRIWWVFPLIAILPVGVELVIAAVLHLRDSGTAIALGLGAGLGASMVFFDSPPAHIERWRVGAEGEKATARQLRPLLKRGWTLFNDLDTGHGNIDHVLVGPAGVFMLESKRLTGQVRVEDDRLIVRWHEDPEDGYENATIASRARGAAYELHRELARAGHTGWVQPVVVLWGDFDQRSIKNDRVAWVRGDQLAEVLKKREASFSGDALDRLTIATQGAVAAIRQDPQLSQ